MGQPMDRRPNSSPPWIRATRSSPSVAATCSATRHRRQLIRCSASARPLIVLMRMALSRLRPMERSSHSARCSYNTWISPYRRRRAHDSIEAEVPEVISSVSSDIVKAFTDAFTTDDVDNFYKLIDPDAEWVIMATGETFRGLE